MRRIALALVSIALACPALADTYPVAGRFGVSAWTQDGRIDCAGKRVVTFIGNQRRDTGGGVPTFVNRSVTRTGPDRFAVVDEFTTGQIYYAKAVYDLYIASPDRILLDLQPGGALKLQRCE
jgi:hypothetical protein